MKYRTKPVEVDVIRYTGDWDAVVAWLDEISGGRFVIRFGDKPPFTKAVDGSLRFSNPRPGSAKKLAVGGYILREANGTFSPLTEKELQAQYESGNVSREYTDEDTLFKARDAMQKQGLSEAQAMDVINELLNAGILFRERARDESPREELDSPEESTATAPLDYL
jgi:hypothetical protein